MPDDCAKEQLCGQVNVKILCSLPGSCVPGHGVAVIIALPSLALTLRTTAISTDNFAIVDVRAPPTHRPAFGDVHGRKPASAVVFVASELVLTVSGSLDHPQILSFIP